jgi:hypothetical protein
MFLREPSPERGKSLKTTFGWLKSASVRQNIETPFLIGFSDGTVEWVFLANDARKGID